MKIDKRWRGVPLGSRGRYRATIVRDIDGLSSVWLAGKDGTCMVLDRAEAADLLFKMIEHTGRLKIAATFEGIENG